MANGISYRTTPEGHLALRLVASEARTNFAQPNRVRQISCSLERNERSEIRARLRGRLIDDSEAEVVVTPERRGLGGD